MWHLKVKGVWIFYFSSVSGLNFNEIQFQIVLINVPSRTLGKVVRIIIYHLDTCSNASNHVSYYSNDDVGQNVGSLHYCRVVSGSENRSFAPNLMFLRRKIGADVTDVNIKLQIRVINRHIISYIKNRCDRCEYKAKNESYQQTHNFIHYGWM